jgi:hypothetical protein
MPEPSEFVVVRAFTHLHEADLACSALEAEGLGATVADESFSRTVVSCRALYACLKPNSCSLESLS